MITGWKTIAGAAMVAAGAVLRYLGFVEIADSIMGLGAALGIFGLGHKVEKSGKAARDSLVDSERGSGYGKSLLLMILLPLVWLLLLPQPAVALEWRRASQATVGWTAPSEMPGSTLQYRVFMRTVSGQVAEAGVTSTTGYTLTLQDGQKIFVEVQTERVVDGAVESVSERRAASDNPADCLNGMDFGLKRFDPPGHPGGLRAE